MPPGLTSYSTRVDATATLGVYVDIDASLNLSTGLLTVTFTSLDPTTLDTPSNPLVGFLPPDTNPPNGEGYINYTIQPKAGLATGAALNAQASIVFDTNAAIATPQIVNTIDASPPTSTVDRAPRDHDQPQLHGLLVRLRRRRPGHRRLQRLRLRRRRLLHPLAVEHHGNVGDLHRPGRPHLRLLLRRDRPARPRPADPDDAQAATAVVTSTPPPPPPPAPPPVTVTSMHWETVKFKVGKGKHAKTKSETALEIQFSAPVAGAGDLAAYRLSGVTTKKVNKKTVTSYKPIRLASVLPASAPMTSSVTIVPAAVTKVSQTDRLQITAAGLTDALGRALDGNDDGQPGSDFVATFGRAGLRISGVASARLERPQAVVLAALDVLLDRGELAGLHPVHRV